MTLSIMFYALQLIPMRQVLLLNLELDLQLVSTSGPLVSNLVAQGLWTLWDRIQNCWGIWVLRIRIRVLVLLSKHSS